MRRPSRRQLLTGCGAALAFRAPLPAAPPAAGPSGFRYCLITATLQGYKLDLVQTIEVAAKTGYDAIEPWLSLVSSFVKAGGSLAEIRKRLAGLGLTVESAIAFAQWMADDPVKRAVGMEQARRDMDAVQQLGGKRIAAPPAGADTGAAIPLPQIVERYRALLELGDRMGVVPELEFWGSSVNLHGLSEAVYVALETRHPKACLLPDVFHLYKGGSGFEGFRLLSAQAVQVLHMNDYPADPPRETVADRDRVYPGDGIAPMKPLFADLRRMNPDLVLSLELFNPAYWKADPLETAKSGLAKMKQVSL